ncbi:MAG: Transketolase [Parcubacteria group bacterium GW2011_GWF2_39_13b]|nr:MAG: Transketolase [Parcubacteria group bacterium GW2011_GWF2_39_13b]
MYNILEKKELSALKKNEPKRFKYSLKGGAYLDLRGLELAAMEGIDVEKINYLAKIVRGFAFAAIDGIKSGHPGGSSSKVEQILSLLFSGIFAFDPMNPKNPGRSRIVWSAGHCTPLSHSVLALIYTALQKSGIEINDETKEKLGAVRTDCLARFRHCDGPSGHLESRYALADASTGSSGHGFSAALGLALLQKSNGLDAKVFVMAGDAETEEGMSYEARNSINSLGMDNLIVSLDYNLFGIDGPISDVIKSSYVNSWFGSEWNIIEVDGHNVLELVYAYKKAVQGFNNDKATVIICHTIKGKEYGKFAGTADSHGTPAPHDEYVQIMKKLGFDVPGIENETMKDIDIVASHIKEDDVKYILSRLEESKKLIEPEEKLKKQMEKALSGRSMADYKSIKRPEVLPPELVFKEGEPAATRKATEAFFKWLMGQTAFFYLGSGDLMKSILTGAAENVFGIINKDNHFGRGIRFGIAEQNMAMMSSTLTQDILPGGFQAMSVFASYGVFTSIMSNPVRMALINNAVNQKMKGFFIMLAAHDGMETGEDGPTHHGLFWMSLFNAYPGIKVYKPMDANETIEMLFYALEKGEPIALSVARPNTPVFKREGSIPPAREAINGAYVFKPFQKNGKSKKILAVCGGQVMANILEILPELEKDLDIKLVAVTSPELFEELREKNSEKANSILSDEERQYVITLHNGWPGFLNPFILPADYDKRVIGVKKFLKSGPPAEVYKVAEFDSQSLKNKILKAIE